MASVTVCARFRPLSSREKRDHGDSVCIRSLDTKSFVSKDVKQGNLTFCFDRVFYQHSSQDDLYQLLALPIVRDAINAINGTIITYGQGPSMSECDGQKKGILPWRSIWRKDLFDLSKDNLQIRDGKTQGIFLWGATEICIMDAAEALQKLSVGVANRAVGETQMNMASSRSHCVYIFSVLQESTNDGRVKTGKLVLVDLAGSEKVKKKTRAEERVLEEAKTINKSLFAISNVINALTNGKMNHIPYRNSKLTRILQDALVLNSPNVDLVSKKLLDGLIKIAIEPLDRLPEEQDTFYGLLQAKVWIGLICVFMLIVWVSVIMDRDAQTGTGFPGTPPPT